MYIGFVLSKNSFYLFTKWFVCVLFYCDVAALRIDVCVIHWFTTLLRLRQEGSLYLNNFIVGVLNMYIS